MRCNVHFSLLILTVAALSCSRPRADSANRERGTPAYEAGRAAREIAKESQKAARAAGRELKNGAREAHEGWKDQSRADRERNKR